MHPSIEGNSLGTSTDLTAGTQRTIAGETIAAISTPAGEGAIALVRHEKNFEDAIRGGLVNTKLGPA